MIQQAFLCLFMVLSTHGYNLDYEYAVVKKGSTDGELFGFSVLQHKENKNNWMLVGAPKGSNQFLRGQDQESGTVFKCNATSPTLECTQQVPFDEASSSGVESKKDQWLGVSLTSGGNDDAVMSCGHRYNYHGSSSKSYSLLIGQCYTVEDNLEFGSGAFSPCKEPLKPFLGGGSTKTPNYQNYGQCLSGLGTGIQKSDGDESDILIGALGALSLTGRIFKERSDNTNPKWGPTNNEAKFQDSYFGYAVAMGKFTVNQGEVAVGGPRHESHGKVLIYKNNAFKDISSEPAFDEKIIQVPSADYEDAEVQIASGFGIALTAIDIDHDGFDELIVGAPFYADKKKPNMGRVYVFGLKDNKFALKKSFYGGKEAYSSFGYSVANVGDLNLDGYDDLVVGAPHREDNKGVVFIYEGTNIGLAAEPQIIKAEEVVSTLASAGTLTLGGFGRSVAGGLDLDNNGYKDVLIGAYSTDHAVLLRSRPIISPHTTLQFDPPQIDPREENKNCDKGGPTKTVCFNVKLCHNITGQEFSKTTIKSVNMKFTLTADAGRPNDPRVFITDKSNVLEFIAPSYSNEIKCYEIKDMYLEFGPDGTIAEYPDVKFTVAYSIPYDEAAGSPKPVRTDVSVASLDAYPILHKKFKDGHAIDAGLEGTQLTFKRECTQCIPDLKVTSAQSVYSLRYRGTEFEFNITIENNGKDPAYAVDLAFDAPESMKVALVREVGSTKGRDCSNNTCLNIIPKLPSNSKKHFLISLNTEKYLPEHSNTAIIKVSSINDEQPATLADNEKKISFDIKVVADISLIGGKSTQSVAYTGKIKGEKAMEGFDDIGQEVEHKFAVRNRGPDLLPSAILTINWPALTLSGKHLLYLIDVTKSPRMVCEQIPVNTAEITSRARRDFVLPVGGKLIARVRRQADNTDNNSTTTPTPTTDGGDGGTGGINVVPVSKPREGITLSCPDKTAICQTIRCEITNLPSKISEQIVFRSRLWEPSLLLDYYGEVLTIVSNGKVELGQNISYITDPDPNNNYNDVYTIINPVLVKAKSKIAVWIIALAVVAGIILLALLVFGLFKLGFFKRNRKPEYYGQKKEQEKSLLKK
ncbi:integrin alpha-3-like [Clytia hemisphaerica]|uniref:Integrin alpha-2 domain-containing protein n=1 Tax=Clytia hemisphaerica TaxID=252671 RepID=A0A7M5XD38_9CNID